MILLLNHHLYRYKIRKFTSKILNYMENCIKYLKFVNWHNQLCSKYFWHLTILFISHLKTIFFISEKKKKFLDIISGTKIVILMYVEIFLFIFGFSTGTKIGILLYIEHFSLYFWLQYRYKNTSKKVTFSTLKALRIEIFNRNIEILIVVELLLVLRYLT